MVLILSVPWGSPASRGKLMEGVIKRVNVSNLTRCGLWVSTSTFIWPALTQFLSLGLKEKN